MSPSTSETDRPGIIDARPVRHPWRWVAVAGVVVVLAMIVSSFVTNPRWDWPFVGEVMVQKPVLEGLMKGTIVGTIGAMIIGVSLGVVLAVMRLSENPVLRVVSGTYTWLFRSLPRYVLLVTMGSLGYLYPVLDIGVPFGQPLGLTFAQLDINALSNSLLFGILGLGLSEAAYMAEIARSGIQSVDPGQTEAAQAIGMSPTKTMRRIVLPQAMRVIVPPTGNETIAMLKDTSLLAAIPITTELFFQVQAIGTRTLKIMPSLIAACVWYIIISSVFMLGQLYLERYFGRGFGPTPKKTKQELTEIGADH